MTGQEENYLWEYLEHLRKETLAHDPAMFESQVPKDLEISEEACEFFRSMGELGAFPVGFIENIIQEKTGSLMPSGLSVGKSSESPQQQEQQQEKTNFDVVLKGFAAESKVKLIKEVKNMLNIGLKDAKEQVEGVSKEPLVLFKAAPKDKAEELLSQLKELGAEVELQ